MFNKPSFVNGLGRTSFMPELLVRVNGYGRMGPTMLKVHGYVVTTNV